MKSCLKSSFNSLTFSRLVSVVLDDDAVVGQLQSALAAVVQEVQRLQRAERPIEHTAQKSRPAAAR